MAPAFRADLGSAVVSHRPGAVKSATDLGRHIAVQPLLHLNIELGIRDVEAWLRGIGAARINNEMADVATAEIRARRFKDAWEVFEQVALAEGLQRVFSCCWTEWGDDHDNDLP